MNEPKPIEHISELKLETNASSISTISFNSYNISSMPKVLYLVCGQSGMIILQKKTKKKKHPGISI